MGRWREREGGGFVHDHLGREGLDAFLSCWAGLFALLFWAVCCVFFFILHVVGEKEKKKEKAEAFSSRLACVK